MNDRMIEDINDLYKFDSLDEIVGNSYQIKSIRDYLLNFNNKLSPLLVYGPTGTGKTSIVKFLINSMDFNLIELDASDYRDKDTIKNMLFSASESLSLSSKRNVILLDEIDNLNNRFDAGAPKAILDLIKMSHSPIIFIANDAYNLKISFLRDKTSKIEFKKLSDDEIITLLKEKSSKFGIRINEDIGSYIANLSNGDARAALNDLFAIYSDGDVSDEEGYSIVGARDKSSNIFDFLKIVFGSNTLPGSLHAISEVDMQPNMLINWIDENIPLVYEGKDVANAFNMLSNATIYSTRAVVKQYYGYWRYMNVFMTSGVALSKSTYYFHKKFQYPKFLKELSNRKDKNKKLNEISIDLKHSINESLSNIKLYYIPMIKEMIITSSSEMSEEEVYNFLELNYGLNEKQIDFIRKS